MPDRISCCVPYCRRTCRNDGDKRNTEWICAVHWPLVPKKLKVRRRLARTTFDKIERRFYRKYPQSEGYSRQEWQKVDAAWQLACRAWEKCKQAAIEAALGI